VWVASRVSEDRAMDFLFQTTLLVSPCCLTRLKRPDEYLRLISDQRFHIGLEFLQRVPFVYGVAGTAVGGLPAVYVYACPPPLPILIHY
jgi:hypothetical protein